MLPVIVLTAAYSFERNTGRKILLEKIEIRKNYGIKKVNIIYVTTVQVAWWYFFRLFFYLFRRYSIFFVPKCILQVTLGSFYFLPITAKFV